MRPVGGSATEASDGGVGGRGSNSGGVAPKGTAKTGVEVASAADPYVPGTSMQRGGGPIRSAQRKKKRMTQK